MACATLFHSQPSKRHIDSVDGVDQTGSPSKCKRSSNLDFGLSSSSFGSPPRFGRSSPPYRETGRLSPKNAAKPLGAFSSPLSLTSISSPFCGKYSENISWSTSESRVELTCKSPPVDREVRASVDEVVQLCKQELRQLDGRLRQEYEQALQDKLAEQYQSFIQFAQDELRTNMQGAPPDAEMSYVG